MRAFWAAILLIVPVAGCRDAGMLELLQKVIPSNAQPQILESCSTAFGLGGTVALFNMKSASFPKTLHGTWSHESSLNSFVSSQSDDLGRQLGRTILDGKECLRRITPQAEHILFGQNPGFYNGLDNGHVVTVIFDHPPDSGVIFVQGR